MDQQNEQPEDDDTNSSKPVGGKPEGNGAENDAVIDSPHRKIARYSKGEQGDVSGRTVARNVDNPGSPRSRTTKDSPERKGVPHVYRDFSNVPDSVTMVRKKTGGVATPFPEKLHHMLDIESNEHPSAVSWLSHGRAFLVHDPHEFTDYIMPK